MMQPIVLDLFCGAGGASEGYAQAGFHVVGVDIRHRRGYPWQHDFVRDDALAFLEALDGTEFDLIHASPPCQRWSEATGQNGDRERHPDLIGQVRDLLMALGADYVIENVPGSPLRSPITLCGTSFPGLRVLRHREFEINWPLADDPPRCPSQTKQDRQHPPILHPYDVRRKHREGDEWTEFLTVTGGSHASLAAARDAMGIDWMSRRELVDAIPPAYTKWIGEQHMLHAEAERKH